MGNFNELTITEAVIDRMRDTPNPRLTQIGSSLVRHAHDFVRDVRLTEAEWAYAIDFLTRTGKICDGNRQEFILLSDTLGLSVLVDAVNHASKDSTESTVLGPFDVQDPPGYPLGSDIHGNLMGEPLYVHGRITSVHREPLANARVDVWHSDSDGYYDVQHADQVGGRARFFGRQGWDISFLVDQTGSIPHSERWPGWRDAHRPSPPSMASRPRALHD